MLAAGTLPVSVAPAGFLTLAIVALNGPNCWIGNVARNVPSAAVVAVAEAGWPAPPLSVSATALPAGAPVSVPQARP